MPDAVHLGSGKVRELYALDDERLLLVASDRISTFDVVLPTAIPDKGRVLTGMSAFWFARTADICANHLLGLRPDGRSTECRRLEMLPIECVVRGYLSGSIDVVLRVPVEGGHRFVVVDYKTNRLGEPGEPLTAAGMDEIMTGAVEHARGFAAALDALQKAQKLLVAMARHAAPQHLTVQHVESSEQRRGPMARVIVALPLRDSRTQGQNRLRTIQGLNLALLIDT